MPEPLKIDHLMADEQKTELSLEIAYVLFIDIVGYSKLLIDRASEAAPGAESDCPEHRGAVPPRPQRTIG